MSETAKNETAKKNGKSTLLEKLEEQHGKGKLIYADTADGFIACRAPNIHEHQRMSDKMGDKTKSDFAAQKEYVWSCRAYPEDRDDFQAFFDRNPAAVQKFADALFKIAGGDLEIETGK